MTSQMSLSARLSSQPVVDLTKAHDSPCSAATSVPFDVESEGSSAPKTQDKDTSTSRRPWLGAAGRAWYEETIAVRNPNNLHVLPWKAHHWKEVAQRLKTRGFDRFWKTCRAQYSNLRVKWTDRCHLLEQSGFGIDDEGKISVEDSVWDRFVESLSSRKKTDYEWHRKNIFPNLDLAKDLFADTNMATGKTVAYLDDISMHRVTDMSEYQQDKHLSTNHGNMEENTFDAVESQDEATSSRKRALTASAPIPTSAKKSKILDLISEKLDGMTAAMEATAKPVEVEVVDKDERLVRDAVACWNREFEAIPSKVKLAFMEEWRKDRGKALQFVLLEPHDRQYLVQQTFPSTAEEGENRRETGISKSQKPSIDEIHELLERLDDNQWEYVRRMAVGWEESRGWEVGSEDYD